ncbi:putative C-S lyase [Verrucomicrobiaceae bacterium N1E253]|uniref:cysteine-S-conjugate beta-lyase n=1 Tax=Oceaniferula marina TaxID=2748318 RepID=A0A851GQN2_9BACT|nr:PatB family C-S lyase [Oceaniferula marina]NWK57415.1 putative C-S lyase [Oceaniferula marina]
MTTQYDFDRIIPRRGTGSLKWDKFSELDPFWVADMDFTAPPEVLEAIQSRLSHGVLGYAVPHQGLVESLQTYMLNRHSIVVEDQEIVHLGGLVCALSLIARAFGKPGEAIMTCTPIYPPFLGVHHDIGMKCITAPHIQTEGRWEFDWDAMEATVTPETKIFLLSNPQNPLGRVFTAQEVKQLAEFCERHDLILVSDEIHCDLILDESSTPHVCAAGLPEELQKRIITLLAPSKTYNIAGLGYAFAVIKDDALRSRFTAARGHILPEINCLAYYAAESAYRDGENWRQALLAYLRKNRDTITEFVRTRLPGCAIPDIEATYLAWIDCRALDLDTPADRFEKEASLYLSDGNFFGAPGHVRFNYGCPHSRLLEGLEKMANVIA